MKSIFTVCLETYLKERRLMQALFGEENET